MQKKYRVATKQKMVGYKEVLLLRETEVISKTGSWEFDLQTKELYWSDGVYVILGLEPQTFPLDYDKGIEVMHPDDRDEVLRKMKEVILNGEDYCIQNRLITAKGAIKYIKSSGKVLCDDSNKPVKLVDVFQDITDFEATLPKAFDFFEDEYRLQIKTSMQVLVETGESFDLELLLNTFNGNPRWVRCIGKSDRLKDKCLKVYGSLQDIHNQKITKINLQKLFEERNNVLESSNNILESIGDAFFAVDGSLRMRQIIPNILAFSRVGKDIDSNDEIDLNETISEVCQLQHRLIEEKNASMHFQNLPIVMSYRSPIVRVFQNLIGNALKYSKPNLPATIEVAAKEFQNEWEISIKDNGIGIDKKYYKKIFILFQRLHVKEEYKGTGIGLAIVKKILDNLAGQIWVTSEEGEGSAFYFTLPK